MSKKCKQSRLRHSLLTSYAAIGSYSLFAAAIYLNFFASASEQKPGLQAVPVAESKPLAVKLIPLKGANQVASRSAKAVGLNASMAACAADDWVCAAEATKMIVDSKGRLTADLATRWH